MPIPAFTDAGLPDTVGLLTIKPFCMKPVGENVIEQLFKQHYPFISCFAKSLVADYAAAEDIATDVFISFWLKYGKDSEQIKNIRAYLLTSVRNQCILFKKNQERQGYSNQVFHELYNTPANEEIEIELLIGSCIDKLFEYLEQLPPGYQKVFKLYHLQEQSTKQIADLMNVSIGTIKSQKYHAEQRIRQKIKSEKFSPFIKS